MSRILTQRQTLTMMELGGQGPYCISVLWGLTALLLVFLVLRVYTRVVCVASYGIDDNFYNISIVSVYSCPFARQNA